MMDQNKARGLLTDFALGKLTPEESLEVLDAVERDPALSRELEEIIKVERGVSQERDKAFWDTGTGRGAQGTSHVRDSGVKYMLRAAAVLVIVVGVSVLLSILTAGRYVDLVEPINADLEIRVRGVEVDDLSQAKAAHLAGNDSKAIQLVDRFLRMDPMGGDADYAHFLAGEILFGCSERSYLGLFRKFDRGQVLDGMKHFDPVAAGSENVRLAEESRWMLAKGHLMLGQPREAVEQLRALRVLGGQRVSDADQMIGEILRRMGS